MREIELLVEAYLLRNAPWSRPRMPGGTVPLPDGRAVTAGRAEFDALLGERRKRAWLIVRRQVPVPARR